MINQDNMVTPDPPNEVGAFQYVICNECRTSNQGDCIKESDECPVELVAKSYTKAS